MSAEQVPAPLTPHEIIDALVEARGSDAATSDIGRASFLAGYDAALDAARRLADYPWHQRPGGTQ